MPTMLDKHYMLCYNMHIAQHIKTNTKWRDIVPETSGRAKKTKLELTAEHLALINLILAQDKVIIIEPKRDAVAISTQTKKIEQLVTSGGA